jgi:hypothetical protein
MRQKIEVGTDKLVEDGNRYGHRRDISRYRHGSGWGHKSRNRSKWRNRSRYGHRSGWEIEAKVDVDEDTQDMRDDDAKAGAGIGEEREPATYDPPIPLIDLVSTTRDTAAPVAPYRRIYYTRSPEPLTSCLMLVSDRLGPDPPLLTLLVVNLSYTYEQLPWIRKNLGFLLVQW